jgi:small subunit ribosomal protein S19
MSRSAKKGPYIDENLLKKIQRLNDSGQKQPVKTWARDCQIAPEFVGHRIQVHNGRTFVEVFIVEDMIGYRLGEFAPTRKFHGHGQVTKRVLEKT